MILNYLKYAFYILIASAGIGGAIWIKSAIVAYKDEAVRAALGEIKTQQKDITIGQQDNVIKQSAVVFKKAQQIVKESAKVEKEIISATTTPEKVKVKYDIIEEMNCRINNFNDDSICVKP